MSIKFLLLFLPFALFAKPTICLNMIVKNESRVIERCLESVKPYIDYWVIVDTGSSDDTMDKIRNSLKDVPGELHKTEWVDFAHCRNVALEHAKGKGDYLFFIDADEEFISPTTEWIKSLTLDTYFFRVENKGIFTPRLGFIKNRSNLHWEGAIHETIAFLEDLSSDLIKHAYIDATSIEGNRSADPQKLQKDIALLENLVKTDPTNPRHPFYLAQSYYSCQNYPKAIEYYSKFAKLGGWPEEVFAAIYFMADAKKKLQIEPEEILKDYSAAITLHPHRIEPYYHEALLLYEMGETELAFLICREALGKSIPPHSFYVQEWIYNYGLSSLYGACALDLGEYKKATHGFKLALENRAQMPPQSIEYLEKNLKIAQENL